MFTWGIYKPDEVGTKPLTKLAEGVEGAHRHSVFEFLVSL